MLAQSKTDSRRDPNYRSALELRIRSAFRRVEHRFSLTVPWLKTQILKYFQREPRLRDARPEEPYFWVESYNSALLEADVRQVLRRVQSALRDIEQRRGCLERNMDAAEWNLLHYAEMVLHHLAGTTPLRLEPRPPRTSSARREENAA